MGKMKRTRKPRSASRGSRAPSGFNPPIQAINQNTTFYAVEEATEGTNPGYTGTDAIAMRPEGESYNTNRELLEPGYRTSSWSKTAPTVGQVSDDTGFVLPVWARGKGSGSKIDYAVPMKVAMGSEVQSTSGTVNASPAPSTIGFTLATGSVSVGDIIRVNGEYTRVLTEAAGAITFWPPLTAAPSGTDAVTVDYTYKLLSDNPSFVTMSGIWEFNGNKYLEFLGCRCGFEMNFEVGQRCSINFNVIANNYDPDYASSVTPTIDSSTEAPVCLGIGLYAYYVGTVGAGATVDDVPVVSSPEIDLEVGDYIIIDVGAGVYETRQIDSFSGLTVTVDTSLSGAPSEGNTLYIRRGQCGGVGDSLGITVEMESDRVRCMAASSGTKKQYYTGRTVTVNKTPYFESWYELQARDAVVGSEIWVILGDTDNNIMIVNMPNVINQGVSLGTEMVMKYSVDALAVRDSVDNDELFIAFM